MFTLMPSYEIENGKRLLNAQVKPQHTQRSESLNNVKILHQKVKKNNLYFGFHRFFYAIYYAKLLKQLIIFAGTL